MDLFRTSNFELRALKTAITDFLFPPFCVVCKKNGPWWCESCQEDLSKPEAWPCLICNKAESAQAICESCREISTLDGLLITSQFTDSLRTVVHELKYKYAEVLAPLLGELLMSELQTQPFVDLDSNVHLIPVPLHTKRYRTRGFNQSELLTTQIHEHLPELSINSSLKRIQYSTSQMTLDRDTRLSNLEGVFSYDGEALSGKTILLIDDVCTTGATLLACAGTLQQAGPKAIWGLVLGHGRDRDVLNEITSTSGA